MRKCHFPARVGDDNLAPVQMPREHEVESSDRETAGDAREVAEQNAEIGSGVGKFPGSSRAARIALGVDTHDLDPSPTSLDDDRLVPQQPRHILNAIELCRAREGIARDCNIVVAEDDARPLERAQQLHEQRHAARMGDEIAGDADEIRSPFGYPRDRTLRRHAPTGGYPQVEVGEVGDPEADKALGQAYDLDLVHTKAEPPRFEPPIGDESEREKRKRAYEGQDHAMSLEA